MPCWWDFVRGGLTSPRLCLAPFCFVARSACGWRCPRVCVYWISSDKHREPRSGIVERLWCSLVFLELFGKEKSNTENKYTGSGLLSG